jgi:hypothetical protein
MSQVGDALSGSGGSGVTDTTGSSSFGDVPNITDATFSGLTDADIMGGGSAGNDFNSFNTLMNAFSGGGTSGGAGGITAAGAIPTAAASGATGGDPVGATGGTQSNTTPGSAPASTSSSSGGQNQNQTQSDPNHAPQSAVDELKTLLKGLSGKPSGPSGPVPANGPAPFALPTVAAGQTGAQSPPMLPGLAPGQTGAPSPPMLPGVAAGQTGPQSPGSFYGTPVQPKPPVDVSGSTPAAARVPPGAASAPAAAPEGRDITVKPKVTPPAAPVTDPQPDAPAVADQPAPAPAAATPAAPSAPATAARPPSRLIQDITGRSTGAPTTLPELVQIASLLLPLAGMLMGGGRRGGGFHGGRFTHGVGGFGHLHGGRHPAAPGAWPYHHPQFGWHMHGGPPGHGWLPLNPVDAQSMVGGGGAGQSPTAGLDPNHRPTPNQTGARVGPADGASSGATPGVSAKQYDDFARDYAKNIGVDPDTASRVLGQESSYGQNTLGDIDPDTGKPTSFGGWQLHRTPGGHALGDQYFRATGVEPGTPGHWQQETKFVLDHVKQVGWGDYVTTMGKLGMNQWSGVKREPVVSTTQPQHLPSAAAIASTLPITSQPMVAGG